MAMVRCAEEDRILVVALTVGLCLALSISSGCRKKGQSEGMGKAVRAEELARTYAAERMAWAGASAKSDLRILYAGLLETDRATDFVAFLAAHFEKVETTDYLTFKGDESAGFDVTIIDRDGVGCDESALFKLSPQYAHAAVAVGVPGALLCQGLRLKTGYL
jgi:hypothetical protein